MGIEQLARLLTDAAEHVTPPQLAEAAWAQAAQVRRRRRVAGSSAAAVVLMAAGSVVVAASFAGPDPDDATPTVTVTFPTPPTTQVDRMPVTLPPDVVEPLPRFLDDLGDTEVVRLSTSPVSRAVALYEQPGTATSPGEVYVIDGDGVFRRIDIVALSFVADEAKNPSAPLTPTALSPAGRLAAFPQHDSVVVVDLTTAQYRRFPVAGFNLQVRWQGSGTVLVGQTGATYSVDLATSVVTSVAGGWSLSDGAPDPLGGNSIVELTPSGGSIVREWTLGDGLPYRTTVLDQRGFAPYTIGQWHGPAWRNGDLVTRVGHVAGLAPVVAVVDVRTGVLTRVLTLAPDRAGTCCTTLGWLDPTTVLVQTEVDGVVAWDIRTGQVRSVTAEFKGILAVSAR